MVDPVALEKFLQMLRRNGVAAYKDEQLELVLQPEVQVGEPEVNDQVEQRGVTEIGLYDHLGFNPEDAFPAKGD